MCGAERAGLDVGLDRPGVWGAPRAPPWLLRLMASPAQPCWGHGSGPGAPQTPSLPQRHVRPWVHAEEVQGSQKPAKQEREAGS